MEDDSDDPISLTGCRFAAADASPAHAEEVDTLLLWTLLGMEMDPGQRAAAVLLVREWLPEAALPAATGRQALAFGRRG